MTVLTNAEMSLLLNATQDTQTPAWAGTMTSAIATMAKLAEAYFVEKQKALGVVAGGIVGPRTLKALNAQTPSGEATADEIVKAMVRKHRADEAENPTQPTTQVVDFRKLDVD